MDTSGFSAHYAPFVADLRGYVESGWPGGCLLWAGAGRHPAGYVYVSYGGTARRLHRVVWHSVHDEWPRQHLDHTCERKDCYNLTHYEDVSNAENQRRRHTPRTQPLVHPGVRPWPTIAGDPDAPPENPEWCRCTGLWHPPHKRSRHRP